MHALSKATRYTFSLSALACLLAGPRPAAAYYDTVFHHNFEAAYYVSDSEGSDSGAGTQQSPWRSISRAVTASNGAPAGATVYVAAGTYHEVVDVKRNNMTLIGYKAVPGDQPPVLANVPVDTSAITMGSISALPTFDPADMPLIVGPSRNVESCMSLRGVTGAIVKNFNLKGCNYGILLGKSSRTQQENHFLFNVNVLDTGKTDDYGGSALSVGMLDSKFGNGDLIESCLVINATSEALTIVGFETVARNVHVYSTDGPAGPSTDYYAIVYGDYNRVEDSYAWRLPGAGHTGHGFTFKDNSPDPDQTPGPATVTTHYNVFRNNVAVNMGEGFVVRHRGVSDNHFIGNTAYGTYGQSLACSSDDSGAYTKYYGSNGITIRDGASNNTFIDTHAYDVCSALTFVETVEDGGALATPPDGNLISGLLADNSHVGIYYRYCPYGNCGSGQNAGANRIEDSTLSATHTIFDVEIPANQMQYANNCFVGVAGAGDFWQGSNGLLSSITPGQFSDSLFVNIANYPSAQGWPAQVASCDD